MDNQLCPDSYVLVGVNSSNIARALIEDLLACSSSTLYLLDRNASSLAASFNDSRIQALDMDLSEANRLSELGIASTKFVFFARYVPAQNLLDLDLAKLEQDCNESIVAAFMLTKAIYKICAKMPWQKQLVLVSPYMQPNNPYSPYGCNNALLSQGLKHFATAFKTNNMRAKLSVTCINTIYPEQVGLTPYQRDSMLGAAVAELQHILSKSYWHYTDRNITLDLIVD